jgi:hypothetical protein
MGLSESKPTGQSMHLPCWDCLPVGGIPMKMMEELFLRTMIPDEGRTAADGAISAVLGDEALTASHGLEKP